MRLTKIIIRNVLGIEYIEVDPSLVTIIEGANGEGKSSILNAIHYAIGGGHDPSILRVGADEGEITLVLDDGMTFRKRITLTESKLTVTHADLGTQKRPQSIVEARVALASVVPMTLIGMKKTDRVDAFLQACPVDVTEAEMSAVVNGRGSIASGLTGLALIDATRESIYTARTAWNTQVKEKRATAAQLAESLPSADDLAIDYGAELAATDKALAALEQERDVEMQRIAADYDRARTEMNEALDQRANLWMDDYTARRRAIEDQIHALDIELAERKAAVEKETIAARQTALDERHGKESELHDRIAPLIADCKENRAAIAARAQDIAKHRNTAEIVATMNDDADYLATRSAGLTQALADIDDFRRGKLESLPIAGVEIRDGDIHRDGVPFDRLNRAQQLDIAFELAVLRSGALPLVFIDNGECLDDDSFAHLMSRAAERGIQLLVSRVANGPLAVRHLEEAAAN